MFEIYIHKSKNGKRISRNVYAKTREECEILLAELIKEIPLFTKSSQIDKKAPRLNIVFKRGKEVKGEVDKYVDYYNNRRMHRFLDFKTPAEIESEYYLGLKKC